MKFLDLLRSIFISPEIVILLIAALLIDHKIGYDVLNTVNLPSAPLWTMISAQIFGVAWLVVNNFKFLLFGNNELEKSELIAFPKRFMIYNRIVAGLSWLFLSIGLTVVGISMFLGASKYYGLLFCATSIVIYVIDCLTLVFAGFILTDILSQNVNDAQAKEK